ncbi:hypothetical protein PTNB85_04580 [Pyrenophora teres f. teres]|uniref:Uncharacterized protein n=1 Tax=Pyrenophora teres f. teres TaxID=97479 RepID=A0A6S6VZL1_9PLEO|nr:hypothetical protein HRS9139_04869 [Pyrenophora teres f. teres]KAE8841181.1 hypothetical protein PTNB85_04580 [Pyrenophora teres f. teres]KAE8864677.1 hypothetical protein PTNB29_04641 [Pyrenophora teres f. teres]CAE7030248.1 hypothetical protein PTTW11_04460 [Pyrenophora teres f. teres]
MVPIDPMTYRVEKIWNGCEFAIEDKYWSVVVSLGGMAWYGVVNPTIRTSMVAFGLVGCGCVPYLKSHQQHTVFRPSSHLEKKPPATDHTEVSLVKIVRFKTSGSGTLPKAIPAVANESVIKATSTGLPTVLRKLPQATRSKVVGVMNFKVPGKIDTAYVDTLLSHKRKRTEEDEAEISQLREDNARLHSVIQELISLLLVSDAQCKKLRDSDFRKNVELLKRARAIREYAAAMAACKPIILEAIESKLFAEMRDRSYNIDTARAQAKGKAEAEYKKKFEVEEIDLTS